MNPLVIVGPTASGKSALAMSVAIRTGGEIVSIDSRQVYRGLDIGTAKPSAHERSLVSHHLLDIIGPEKKTDARWFSRVASKAIRDVLSRSKLPILTGGSGLYLRAVLEGLFNIDLDEDSRSAFAESISTTSTPELLAELRMVDKESAERIHPNDRYRLTRALEVYRLTGLPLSEHFSRQKESGGGGLGLDCLKTGIDIPRDKLRARIAERTKKMFDDGWPDEVRSLLSHGAFPEWYGMKTLGYPEIISYLNGVLSRQEAIDEIILKTSQYAKRQMTWFRSDKDIRWIKGDAREQSEALFKILDTRGFN
ncbi:MAG: tRNA (adenosine(37)-N6)-dimethylallyltransferase MiaA [Candidatus Krumholzibacteria bacterium]|nr:tRNA (adenosine(37)-N6)-dimethylallyltransferase MiaA [Candidatus Krumholzibacteria bacterium]